MGEKGLQELIDSWLPPDSYFPEIHCPRPCGSALKVPGGGGGVGWETPIIIITLHLVELS